MALIAGIQHLRDGVETQAVTPGEFDVVGIVGTAPNADPVQFPLNTPVYIRTNDTDLRTALGAGGTLEDSLAGISAQLANGISAAKCVVVRVTDDVSTDTVIANILGSEAAQTGVWALLDAPEDLGTTPRILITPGYTSQTESDGVTAINITDGGTGYDDQGTVVFTGGGGSGAAGVPVIADGVITGITITNAGTGYTSAPTVTYTGGSGSGLVVTADVGQVANPICAIMPTICERLQGVFIPEGPTSTRQDWLDWKETLPASQYILHPLRQDAKVSVNGSTVTKPLSPYSAGLYVRRDAEFDGRPFHSIANQAMYGLVGVTPTIRFSITDENSEGQQDLADSAGIVFRGDTGVNGSLTDGGFTFWGTDTLSSDSSFLFVNVVRGRAYTEVLQVKLLRYYLGKFNITTQTVQAIVNTLESVGRQLRADGDILDFKVEFDPEANTVEELRLGNLDIIYKQEEPPVLRKILIRSRRHAEALEQLVQTISTTLQSQLSS